MLSSKTGTRILSFLVLQLGWFALVVGAARGDRAAGFCFALILVILFLYRRSDWKAQLLYIAFWTLIGTLNEGLCIRVGAYMPLNSFVQTLGICPLWLTGLWMLFASTIDESFEWLKGRYALAALVGFIASPVSFYAADRLDALEMNSSVLRGALVIAIDWAILIPLMVGSLSWLKSRMPNSSEVSIRA